MFYAFEIMITSNGGQHDADAVLSSGVLIVRFALRCLALSSVAWRCVALRWFASRRDVERLL